MPPVPQAGSRPCNVDGPCWTFRLYGFCGAGLVVGGFGCGFWVLFPPCGAVLRRLFGSEVVCRQRRLVCLVFGMSDWVQSGCSAGVGSGPGPDVRVSALRPRHRPGTPRPSTVQRNGRWEQRGRGLRAEGRQATQPTARRVRRVDGRLSCWTPTLGPDAQNCQMGDGIATVNRTRILPQSSRRSERSDGLSLLGGLVGME